MEAGTDLGNAVEKYVDACVKNDGLNVDEACLAVFVFLGGFMSTIPDRKNHLKNN